MGLRAGGVSRGPFATLNLGLGVGDDPAAVAVNRARFASHFGLTLERVMRLDQVHGATVRVAGPDAVGRQGDAVISDDPAWLHDPVRGAVAAVHAGWRGAVAGIAAATVTALRECYGCRPSDLVAWFGAAIRGPRYQVGAEVAEAFVRAGTPPEALWTDVGSPGRYRADVPALVRAQLLRLGLRAAHVFDSGVCTSGDPRCYSHRRDAGRTGRHWAVIRAAR
jgi:polyphenol oxidase